MKCRVEKGKKVYVLKHSKTVDMPVPSVEIKNNWASVPALLVVISRMDRFKTPNKFLVVSLKQGLLKK